MAPSRIPRHPNVPWSRLSRFFGGWVLPPLIGNPYNGYINPYYWVDDHPLLYGNNGSLDPGTNKYLLRFSRWFAWYVLGVQSYRTSVSVALDV